MSQSPLIFFLLAARFALAEPLDTIAKVRALTPEEAERHLSVLVEATVIYFDRGSGDLFVGDDTASTYVASCEADRAGGRHPEAYPRPLNSGERVRIEGTTRPGGYFPDICQHRVEVIGKGVLPKPRQIGEDELLSPALDSQWVEVPAVVTGVESAGLAFTLAVEVHGWKLKVEIPRDEQSAERAAALMQRPVRLQGCAGTVFNTQRQMTGRFFYAPSFDQLIPTDVIDPAVKPPLRTVIDLLRKDEPALALVRIEGVITQADGNGFYLRDASGSVLVRTARDGPFVPGTRVEAEGFAAIAPFRPVLRARRVAALGHADLPLPVSFDFHKEKLPPYQAELVTLEADFLAQRDGPLETVMQCSTGDRFFEAVLPLASASALPKGLAAGDHVKLTGICELTTTHPTPRNEWVDGFRLHLPAVGGVNILKRASWWTLQHVLTALGLVSAVAFGALAWAWMLRRRVREQTEIIGSQLQRVAVQDERQRIARELHDTVEQGLTGLSMQLGNLSGDMEKSPPQARTAIQLAQRMLRHCREEARASIRDLRSIELEQRGLPGALRELLAPAATGCGARFEVRVSGQPRHIAATTENHLLRIAQEAVINSARHAAPREIIVDLDYTAPVVRLAIHDNGCGFDPSLPAPQGHFGVLGIRERANKIQAALKIESTPGKGTTVRVEVPDTQNSPSQSS